MELFDAILNRRTIKEFRPDPVPDALLEHALSAGLWAQNHRMTQPWRFLVLGTETQRVLAEAGAEAQIQSMRVDTDAATREQVRTGAVQKLMSKPRIVVVTSILSSDAFQRREDYAATCCAIQNIQLAAWGEGLGMQWSTGKQTQQPQTYHLLGIDPYAEEIVGFLYFGYPALIPIAAPRKPLAEVMRRLP
ncbi:MAG: nitroreductase [Caldilineaceae bacterium]|nr:nitroreductase [Caldilineaceae bacterium]